MDERIHSMAGLAIPAAGRTAGAVSPAPALQLPLRELLFRAMGCDCQVLVLGGADGLHELGKARIDELDQKWSRFRADSELTLFNEAAGQTRPVSDDLLELLRRGLAGYRWTKGAFNPFLGTDIVAAGYDRDFESLTPAPAPNMKRNPNLTPRKTPFTRPQVGIALDVGRRLARLEPGLAFDSGGIGKGLGAQLTVEHLLANGAAGAMVSLGGDVYVGGSFPDTGWRIGVDDPLGRADAEPIQVVLRGGSVCSSGVLKRRWLTNEGEVAHHILDPSSGQPLQASALISATAIAPTGWEAEVLTKATLVGGSELGSELVAAHGEAALLLWDETGTLTRVP